MSLASHQILITVDGVRSLKEQGQKFRVRYELVDFTGYGRPTPRYQCVYELESGREAILVGSRLSAGGPEPRTFLLWPGLFVHHKEFGDGSCVCVDPSDYRVFTHEHRPDGNPPRGDE